MVRITTTTQSATERQIKENTQVIYLRNNYVMMSNIHLNFYERLLINFNVALKCISAFFLKRSVVH